MMNILILNALLMGDENATGTTMENVLLNIDNINYLQFCFDTNDLIHKELVPTFYLDEKQIPFKYFLKKIFYKSDKNNAQQKEKISNSQTKTWKHEIVEALMDISPLLITKDQWDRIREFKPEIIYTMIGGSIMMTKLAIKIAKKLNIPIVFHCMDNWRTTKYKSSFLVSPFNLYLNYLIKKMHKYSVVNLAISEKMAQVYEKEYQTPYSYISNCISNFNLEPYQPSKENFMRIIFSGGLHFGRLDSILSVAQLIENLNDEGYNISLEIFVPKNQFYSYKNLFNFKNTSLFEYVKQEKQMENLKRADILLHLESTKKTDIKYMLLSFSTKIVEYMAANRAIIGFGNKEMVSIDYIFSNHCGWVADSEPELKSVFIDAYNSKDKRIKFSENSIKTAQKNHSKKMIQNSILKIFNTVQENWIKKNE